MQWASLKSYRLSKLMVLSRMLVSLKIESGNCPLTIARLRTRNFLLGGSSVNDACLQFNRKYGIKSSTDIVCITLFYSVFSHQSA